MRGGIEIMSEKEDGDKTVKELNLGLILQVRFCKPVHFFLT